MAEAIARKDAPDLWEVSSAGLTPLGYVAPLTIETIKKNKYSAAGLSSKPITRACWQEADLVINMSGYEKNHVFEDSENVEDWNVGDPFGEDPAVYQRIFEEIRAKIATLAERLSLFRNAEFFRANSRRAE